MNWHYELASKSDRSLIIIHTAEHPANLEFLLPVPDDQCSRLFSESEDSITIIAFSFLVSDGEQAVQCLFGFAGQQIAGW